LVDHANSGGGCSCAACGAGPALGRGLDSADVLHVSGAAARDSQLRIQNRRPRISHFTDLEFALSIVVIIIVVIIVIAIILIVFVVIHIVTFL